MPEVRVGEELVVLFGRDERVKGQAVLSRARLELSGRNQCGAMSAREQDGAKADVGKDIPACAH